MATSFNGWGNSFGDAFGPLEEDPPGTMRGAATLAMGATAHITAIADMAGVASLQVGATATLGTGTTAPQIMVPLGGTLIRRTGGKRRVLRLPKEVQPEDLQPAPQALATCTQHRPKRPRAKRENEFFALMR
jgi:hypothetical protein